MQHLEVSGAVRPLKWSLGVKWLMCFPVESRGNLAQDVLGADASSCLSGETETVT